MIVWDQAGFHHKAGDATLPERIHLLPLPPYSPELNPVEELWDQAKDVTSNKRFKGLGELEETLNEALGPSGRCRHESSPLFTTGCTIKQTLQFDAFYRL